MSRLPRSLQFPSFVTVIATLLLSGAAIAVGPLIAILKVGVREIAIVVLIVLMLSLVLMPGERILRFGFTLWIITFAFGWRTIYLTPSLNIHPSEVIAILLLFTTFGRAIINRTPLDFSVPPLILFLMLFAVLGIFTAFQKGIALDVILQEFKVFLAIPMAYFVVKWSVNNRQDWERAARWCIAVAVYIGCLGLMDYFLPGLSISLSGLGGDTPIAISQSYSGTRFARVGFVFFGNFTAGFVIFTFLGFTIERLFRVFSTSRSSERILLLIAFVIQIAGIYLSGYRGLWYAVVSFVAIYVLFQRRALSLLAVGLLAIPLLPLDFINRFQSVFNTQYADSSQYDRFFRASLAFDQFLQSPLTGLGWGGSGYVHSDLIQIAANLGIFGIAFFLFWILGILWRLLRLTRDPGWVQGYARLLFAMVCGLLIVFSGEGMIIFIQLTFPIWFLFAMSDKLTELSNQSNANPIASLASPARQLSSK